MSVKRKYSFTPLPLFNSIIIMANKWKRIVGLLIIAFVALISLYSSMLLSEFTYNTSLIYYAQFFHVIINARVLDGVAKYVEVNITIDNKTVQVTKPVVADSFLYLSIYNNYSMPIYASSVTIVRGNEELLPRDIAIAPYENFTAYFKLPFNVTWGWCGVWVTLNNIENYTCPTYILANTTYVPNSTFSHTFDVYASALLFGKFKLNGTYGPFNVTVNDTAANITKVNLATDNSTFIYYVMNTGPTIINVTSITIKGVNILDNPITIEPLQTVSGAIEIPTIVNGTVKIPPINIFYGENYTVTFTFVIFNETKTMNGTIITVIASDTATESVTAY